MTHCFLQTILWTDTGFHNLSSLVHVCVFTDQNRDIIYLNFFESEARFLIVNMTHYETKLYPNIYFTEIFLKSYFFSTELRPHVAQTSEGMSLLSVLKPMSFVTKWLKYFHCGSVDKQISYLLSENKGYICEGALTVILIFFESILYMKSCLEGTCYEIWMKLIFNIGKISMNLYRFMFM